MSPDADADADAGAGDAARLRVVEAELARRWPESTLEPSLDRMTALADMLGQPQRSYPVIHLTGTNGKTSTARMVDALLHATGLRTGLYTSPHVESVTERIAIDSEPLDAGRFAAAYEDVAPYADLVDARSVARSVARSGTPAAGLPMSFFEVLTGMAFAAFADAPVSVAVVESGMGGAWDATNVADGQVAVVTPVALDHTAYLGSSLEAIAGEKAGIIKPGALAVLAQQPLEVAEVLLRRAVEVEATVAREGMEFGVLSRSVAVGGQQLTLQGLGGVYDEVFLPLHGAHQAHNAACALAAVEGFAGGGARPLDADLVRSAFASVTSPGRLEVVRHSPTILLDAAHNPAGARAAATAIQEAFTFTRLVGMVGMLGDKDAPGLLEAFEPVLAEVVVTESSSPRAMPVDRLAAFAVGAFGADRVDVVPRLDDAVDAAVTLAEEQGDLGTTGVLVTGSVVTVGDVRRLVRARP